MAIYTGTASNDSYTGTAGNDSFATAAGFDFITGTAGNDLINTGFRSASSYWRYGFTDNDTVSYASLWSSYGMADGAVSIQADLKLGTVLKIGSLGQTLGTDSLVGVDTIVGTGGNDVFRGRDAWDTEEFRGGAGNDTIDGRGGYDTAHYGDATAAVTVDLASGSVSGDASVGSDTLRQVENIVGSNHADKFSAAGFGGGSANRHSYGESFNLYTPLGGNDTVTGNGDTTLNYGNAAGALHLSLAGLTSATASADILLNYVALSMAPNLWTPGLSPLVSAVNGLRGSGWNDTLVGGGRVNTLGFTGSSTLSRDASMERFRGLGGNDFIHGGTGLDRAEYNSGGAMTEGITVLLADGLVIGDAAQVGTDTLRGVESITSTWLDDVFDATGFTLDSASAGERSLNSGDCVVVAQNGETLASNAFNEFRAVGGNDLVVGNGATRVSFGSMNVERLNGPQPSVVASFESADSGWAVYGQTDGGLGTVEFSGSYGILGGVGNDSLTGSDGFQELRGYFGNDTLRGGGGNDRLSGHSNGDASAENLSSTFTDDDLLDGGAGNDLLRGDFGNDTLLGGDGVDTLQGGTGNDALDGGAGNDQLQGDAGDDTLDGGNGYDYVGYWGATAAITVDLASGSVRGGSDVGSDTLRGVEGVQGSAHADTYVATGFGGSSLNRSSIGVTYNQYTPVGGNDTVVGNGDTTLSYGNVGGAISVSLAGLTSVSKQADVVLSYTPVAGTSDAGLSPLVSGVNGLRGGAGNDTLVGGGRVNAEGSATTLSGDKSMERFAGGAGNDFIDGGTGLDRAEYTGDTGSTGVSILLAAGTVTGDAARVGTDKLRGIELVTGSLGDDTYDARGFTLRNAASASANSGDVVVSAPSGEVLASQAFNEFRAVGGSDVAIGNGATRVSFASMTVSNMDLSQVSVVAAFDATGSGHADYGLTDGGLGKVAFSGTFGVTGGEGSDSLSGAGGFQELRGYFGNDTLHGGDGNDQLFGFTGMQLALGTVLQPGYGDDDVLDGGTGDDLLVGEFGSDTLQGGTGNDTLDGGEGNDSLDGGTGNDTASYAAATAAVTVSLATAAAQASGGAGSDTLVNIENLEGSAYDDSLTGSTADNQLLGGTGHDTLDGAAGSDTLQGGAGNDTYVVDSLGDVVTELAGGGTDLVVSSISYSLADTDGAGPNGANVEHLRLSGAGALDGTGNALNNTLYAGAGDNRLDGGTGSDTVSYAFAAAGVTVSLSTTTAQATGGSGSDTLLNVENLVGSDHNDTLTGNSAANLLQGGNANDRLEGGSGNDTLLGGAGSDTLVGGTGNDALDGGAGNDTYYVDTLGDMVTELADGGTDLVISTVSYSLVDTDGAGANGASIENLRLSGNGALDATGNALANLLYAGTGDNRLDGGAGDDTVSYLYATAAVTVSLATTAAQVTGGSGNDTLLNVEHLTGSNYSDALTGSTGNNSLQGGTGNDTLLGGSGADLLAGGGGSDVFRFTALTDSGLTEATRDTVTDFTVGQDHIDLSGIDANAAMAGDQTFAGFIAATAAFTAAGQMKFVGNVLYLNTDADTAAEMTIKVLGTATLQSSDFYL